VTKIAGSGPSRVIDPTKLDPCPRCRTPSGARPPVVNQITGNAITVPHPMVTG
jgi:hypothetical protein